MTSWKKMGHPSESYKQGKRGRHKRATSWEARRWEARRWAKDFLIPERPWWMPKETYEQLARMRDER